MAIENNSKWQMIHDVVTTRRTGTIVLQLGRQYVRWIIDAGNVACVSSTLSEQSFTQSLLRSRDWPIETLLRARSMVSDSTSIGGALLQLGLFHADELRAMLQSHWESFSHYLFESASYLFWSAEFRVKPRFAHFKIRFSHLLLSTDRSNIEVRSAIRVVHDLPGPIRLSDPASVQPHLLEHERRVVQYLKGGSCLNEIMRDPDLDRMTCYRTLFLLWLSGNIQEPRARPAPVPLSRPPTLLQRAKTIPPEWIFPLFAGIVLGLLLAPGPKSPQPKKVETAKHIWEQPAWRTDVPETGDKQSNEQ